MTGRIRAIQGGTSASKTVSVMLNLINVAQTPGTRRLISVVSYTLPHLKLGAMRDFLAIMVGHGYFQKARWANFVYTFETGSQIEFFSCDQESKVKGPRRDILFLNEANNVPYNVYDMLEVRTKEYVIMDWNPVSEFWFYTEVLGKVEGVEHIVLTYLDNEALDERIVKSIESHRHNLGWWKVYGLGQLGEVEGRIFTGWQVIPSVPHEARLERKGLDFGYTNDPTAIVDVYRYNGGFVFDQQCYRTGMANRAIADLLNATQKCLVIADSSEPKSIDEIRTYGIDIVPAEKGPGSVNRGIAYVQDQRISVTERSVDLLKEYNNYLWLTDRNGKFINEAQDFGNHCMDAIRYALSLYSMPQGGQPSGAVGGGTGRVYSYGAARLRAINSRNRT